MRRSLDPRRRLPALLSALLSAGASLAQVAAVPPPVPLAKLGAEPLHWLGCEGKPVWWQSVPRLAGQFGFATVRYGPDRDMAMARAQKFAERDVRKLLHEHFAPALGAAQTPAVVEVLMKHVVLIDAQCQTGKGMGSAYLRWQVAIRDAVDEVGPHRQGRIEWMLLRDVVRWQSVSSVPAWAAKVPVRDGYLRVVLTTEGRLPTDTLPAACTTARAEVRERLEGVLLTRLGKQRAARRVEAALRCLAPLRRARWFRKLPPTKDHPAGRHVTTAWVLWEIPKANLLRGLSKAEQERLLAALGKAR